MSEPTIGKINQSFANALVTINQLTKERDELKQVRLDLIHFRDLAKARAEKAEYERDQLAAKVAEMRDVLQQIWDGGGMGYIKDPESESGVSWCKECDGQFPHGGHAEVCAQAKFEHALSDQCGTGWLSPDKAGRLREALERLARLGNEPYYGNSIGNEIAKQALEDCK